MASNGNRSEAKTLNPNASADGKNCGKAAVRGRCADVGFESREGSFCSRIGTVTKTDSKAIPSIHLGDNESKIDNFLL